MRRLLVAPVFFVVYAMAPSSVQAQPAITWSPASSHNYTTSSSRTINSIIIHKSEGSFTSCVNWFKNPSAKVSAHYVVDDTRIYQMVKDKDRAWHAGVTYYNQHAIGIENAGWSNRNDISDAHYRRLASLVAYLCKKYGIAADRQHILGHSQINSNKSDPGPYFNWNLFMGYVKSEMSSTPPPPPPPPPTPTPTPTPTPGNNLLIGCATTTDVNARASAGGSVLGVAPALSGWVRTGQTDQGFSEIFFRGRHAWVYSSYLSGLSGTGVQVKANTLNVRSDSSMAGKIVGAIYQHQTYVKSQDNAAGEWTLIRYDEEKRWVYKSYTSQFALH